MSGNPTGGRRAAALIPYWNVIERFAKGNAMPHVKAGIMHALSDPVEQANDRQKRT